MVRVLTNQLSCSFSFSASQVFRPGGHLCPAEHVEQRDCSWGHEPRHKRTCRTASVLTNQLSCSFSSGIFLCLRLADWKSAFICGWTCPAEHVEQRDCSWGHEPRHKRTCRTAKIVCQANNNNWDYLK
jgi:hypothetical protein